MNIAQELSIVRDNIAEYAIYEQGRQDAMNDDGIPKQLLEMGYKKGKEDAIDECIEILNGIDTQVAELVKGLLS